MKTLKHISTALLLLLAMTVTAQQGINYKALIKDGSGNVVANQLIVVQFTILQGVAQTNVYQEQHTPTTDANGIVIVNIGEGTPISGAFLTINWASDSHFLNVQVNTGSGLVDLGTTEFKAVPYALSATTAITATNVTGLEKITEGANTGWRLIGKDPANYGDIGSDATDLSLSTSASTTKGATGLESTAMGFLTTASDQASTAMGFETTASGLASTALGRNTTASGDHSTAMGYNTRSPSYSETVIGNFNTIYTPAIGGDRQWNPTDRLFTIGNGTSTTNSNALTILKNGTITAPSLTNTLITTAGAKALITKEYADANLKPSGLESITEGTNTGWRLVGRNPNNYGDIGSNAIDLSTSNSASTTYGATGENSTAMGNSTTSSGRYSTAMGFHTKATGISSTATGGTTIASGTASTAMGVQTNAGAYSSTALGRFNMGGGNPGSWVNTDPLFEIGNGTATSNLSNAFTVYKNGRTDVSGTIRSTSGVFPASGEGSGVSMTFINGRGYILSENPDIIFSSIYKELVLGSSVVRPINSITDLGATDKRWLKVYTVNGVSQSSDKRMKKDIKDLNYGLNTVMQLRPVSYKWKQGNQDVNLGLIAQEVQKLLPEVIDVGTDKNKTLGMKYTELIPVLIKGMQEQQKEIVVLKKMVNKLLKRKIIVSN